MNTVFKYKDAWRCWWKLEFAPTGEYQEEILDEETTWKHKVWAYQIYKEIDTEEDGWFPIHSEEFVGQYDEIPSIQDILLLYSTYQQSLILGIGIEYERNRKN